MSRSDDDSDSIVTTLDDISISSAEDDDDPTEKFDTMKTPGAKLRIGLAHGSIVDFGAQGETRIRGGYVLRECGTERASSIMAGRHCRRRFVSSR